MGGMEEKIPVSEQANRNNRGGGHSAFTLIELLLIIAIIAVLGSLMLPGLNRAKERAAVTTCESNLKELGIGVKMYIDDNSFRFPPGNVTDVDGGNRVVLATLGGYDAITNRAQFWASAPRRPLYPYAKPSKVYECPADRGQLEISCYADPLPIKPRNFSVIGCSYHYNGGGLPHLRGGGFLKRRAGILARQREDWVTQPDRFILMHEPPARQFGCTTANWTQWHFGRARSVIMDLRYARQNFFSPILFVDGHVALHNFSKSILADRYHPYEETKDWVWYKPSDPP